MNNRLVQNNKIQPMQTTLKGLTSIPSKATQHQHVNKNEAYCVNLARNYLECKYFQPFNFYFAKPINEIVMNLKLPGVGLFKDMLYHDDQHEYLKQYYTKEPCQARLAELLDFFIFGYKKTFANLCVTSSSECMLKRYQKHHKLFYQDQMNKQAQLLNHHNYNNHNNDDDYDNAEDQSRRRNDLEIKIQNQQEQDGNNVPIQKKVKKHKNKKQNLSQQQLCNRANSLDNCEVQDQNQKLYNYSNQQDGILCELLTELKREDEINMISFESKQHDIYHTTSFTQYMAQTNQTDVSNIHNNVQEGATPLDILKDFEFMNQKNFEFEKNINSQKNNNSNINVSIKQNFPQKKVVPKLNLNQLPRDDQNQPSAIEQQQFPVQQIQRQQQLQKQQQILPMQVQLVEKQQNVVDKSPLLASSSKLQNDQKLEPEKQAIKKQIEEKKHLLMSIQMQQDVIDKSPLLVSPSKLHNDQKLEQEKLAIKKQIEQKKQLLMNIQMQKHQASKENINQLLNQIHSNDSNKNLNLKNESQTSKPKEAPAIQVNRIISNCKQANQKAQLASLIQQFKRNQEQKQKFLESNRVNAIKAPIQQQHQQQQQQQQKHYIAAKFTSHTDRQMKNASPLNEQKSHTEHDYAINHTNNVNNANLIPSQSFKTVPKEQQLQPQANFNAKHDQENFSSNKVGKHTHVQQMDAKLNQFSKKKSFQIQDNTHSHSHYLVDSIKNSYQTQGNFSSQNLSNFNRTNSLVNCIHMKDLSLNHNVVSQSNSCRGQKKVSIINMGLKQQNNVANSKNIKVQQQVPTTMKKYYAITTQQPVSLSKDKQQQYAQKCVRMPQTARINYAESTQFQQFLQKQMKASPSNHKTVYKNIEQADRQKVKMNQKYFISPRQQITSYTQYQLPNRTTVSNQHQLTAQTSIVSYSARNLASLSMEGSKQNLSQNSYKNNNQQSKQQIKSITNRKLSNQYVDPLNVGSYQNINNSLNTKNTNQKHIKLAKHSNKINSDYGFKIQQQQQTASISSQVQQQNQNNQIAKSNSGKLYQLAQNQFTQQHQIKPKSQKQIQILHNQCLQNNFVNFNESGNNNAQNQVNIPFKINAKFQNKQY